MISNSDNLGATVDARIAAHMAREEIPFLMEVVQGTEADRKGGHIARRREPTASSCCASPPRRRTRMPTRFATTGAGATTTPTTCGWTCGRCRERLQEGDGVLELPLIINRKTVDPRDSDSTPVLQLESAMGAAIGSFPGAQLLLVPRTRFVPVKTTDDLLVLRSDVYTVTDEHARHAAARAGREPALRRAGLATTTSCWTNSSSASRTARPRCARPSGWSSRATSPSARGSSCAARPSCGVRRARGAGGREPRSAL